MKRWWRSFRGTSGAPPSPLPLAPPTGTGADAQTRLISAGEAPPERFVLTLPGGVTQHITLSKSDIAIGRATVNDIVLSDDSASRRHARLERKPGGYEVIDLGSVNGLRVNGVRVAHAILAYGDVLGIGDSSIRFERSHEEADPAMTRRQNPIGLDERPDDHALPVHLAETALPRVTVSLSDGTREFPMRGDSLTLGRHPDNDVVIDADGVSRHHAVIERRLGSMIIRDLHSENGVWVGRERVSSRELEDGAAIRIGSARLLFKRGFGVDELAADAAPGATSAVRRPVVVIPGFAGSNLWRGSEQIWPTRMALTQSDLLSIHQPLEARGLVNEVVVVPNLIKQDRYNSLTGYLKESLHYEEGKDLLEFGYDFRQDNRLSARCLAAAIDAWDVRGPITLIAHSMGCLLARYYLECLGGGSRVERVIFLGGPHAGAPYAFASLLQGPNLLPLGLLNSRLRELLGTYPAWYQILPTYAFATDQRSAFNVLTEESWISEERRSLLRNARSFSAEIGGKSSVPAVCVFGYGIKTITGAIMQREATGAFHKGEFVVTPKGDGTVPEVSSVLDGAEIHPVRQHHGALFGDSDVKMRLKHELTRQVP